MLGTAGRTNVQGEEQQKLDVLANEVMKEAFCHTGRVALMASEEEDDPIPTDPSAASGKYVMLFDPLDGSSNIDVNVSIGTIFSVQHRVSDEGCANVTDCLQNGRQQTAAGYVIYGSSTVMVYSAGNGVHCFTLDPIIGEFRLIDHDVETPATGKYYSINESNYRRWSAGYQQAVSCFKGLAGDGHGKNARYIGSLVADFHRNLLAGGIFMYPADTKSPKGKIRLLYEASPLAFVAEQAGGAASDGRTPILDIEPTDLHQRTPLVIGSRDDVAFVERTIQEAEVQVS